jgi:hypothetical protein
MYSSLFWYVVYYLVISGVESGMDVVFYHIIFSVESSTVYSIYYNKITKYNVIFCARFYGVLYTIFYTRTAESGYITLQQNYVICIICMPEITRYVPHTYIPDSTLEILRYITRFYTTYKKLQDILPYSMPYSTLEITR